MIRLLDEPRWIRCLRVETKRSRAITNRISPVDPLFGTRISIRRLGSRSPFTCGTVFWRAYVFYRPMKRPLLLLLLLLLLRCPTSRSTFAGGATEGNNNNLIGAGKNSSDRSSRTTRQQVGRYNGRARTNSHFFHLGRRGIGHVDDDDDDDPTADG